MQFLPEELLRPTLGIYNDNNIGSYGSSYGYHRGSNPFSMGNILTGVALWHVGHGLAHSGHHHHHEHYPSYYQHDKVEDTTGSTLPPEIENPHIQVNADFDFGPTPASTVEPPA
ncbi:uncharacterized protein LOC129745294 isoform X2 [Uranotaenia lowii]|uniref:uncharacterized protein LOC129745294 isoform X2 n=1 Tax=Uranotaenia lowii TaxID=190385 RepID=UPI00247992BE|nr:uncharacterized protein LOC129745294 isoform X2 [Uranotaenia lowii]